MAPPALVADVLVTPRQARQVMEVYLAADLSAERNLPVELPLTREHAEGAFASAVHA